MITRTGRYRLTSVSDALRAAFPAWVTPAGAEYAVSGPTDAQGVTSTLEVRWPGDVSVAQIDAVLAAHNPDTPSATEAANTQQAADLTALKTAYQARLDAIAAGRTALFNGADASWNALTVAQQITRLRAVLLGQLDFDADVLKALRALVVRGGG